MALTSRVFIDSPVCLAVAGVDEAKADGAIGEVTCTNKSSGYDIVVWAVYSGSRVASPVIYPGGVYTRTFRGNSARAGDVDQVGVNLYPRRGVLGA